MKILKVFNNNVSLVLNDDNIEEIIMGKGVGFNKREGDVIDSALIEKRFVLEGNNSVSNLDNLLARIDIEDIELASDIIQLGEAELEQSIDDSILLTLSDHIGFVLNRAAEGLQMRSPLEWDIKQIYTKEYAFALKAVQMMREKTGIEIPDQEAAFITLHFVNAYNSTSNMNETMLTTKIIQSIIDIIKYHYGKEYDETSYDFTRFITHIRYFVKRQLDKEVSSNEDSTLINLIAVKYEQDYQCAVKIKTFLEQQYDWTISNDELMYLTLHLNRLSSNQ
ncbi:BglG family transcription antiterminator LicT [Enterococcus caccae]|uniref:PRD domain-containing protein n=1 Tax=Enterococcus caccae ATCC BAA-1240 TaxID=1158612 RepID=R3U9C0_9ENTE|nr:PRD domain-containing protein [Enterococcus caccae]EOL50063.1 hypothetical protein UC7_00482 [Enterococcus caccae ATCC BAA-1240]EOT56157.1 hypothetical protein I580_02957 [Enterococcus caccae ATCC BAA-1240]OJG25437.1 hypothetical protein RU98_GL000982 [Enterococcus caccae]